MNDAESAAAKAPLRDTGERATHRAAEVGNLQTLGRGQDEFHVVLVCDPIS